MYLKNIIKDKLLQSFVPYSTRKKKKKNESAIKSMNYTQVNELLPHALSML